MSKITEQTAGQGIGRKKLVFISSIATPAQVKFCYALQAYFETEFWFYEQPDRTRGAWWRTELGDKCRILPDTIRLFDNRYMSWAVVGWLDRFNPDIIMIGGLTYPSNYLAYRWAQKRGKKTILFTERSRDAKGNLRPYSLVWRLLRWLYRDIDMVMVSAEDIVPQFRDNFRFGDKVVVGRYAADLDAYYSHPLRVAKPAYTYLLANRMTEIYNPLGGLAIFAEIHQRYPGSRLLMNAAGELGNACCTRIKELGLTETVEFLTDIPSWEHLHKAYARSDILLLPAHFSNGNFTILEAMASGMGIIISNQVLGVGKLIKDGHNGFQCEPTAEAFVERIEHYIADPTLFVTHAAINRPLVQPLSVEGTARFFAETLATHFDR